jgi:hypothetical protein
LISKKSFIRKKIKRPRTQGVYTGTTKANPLKAPNKTLKPKKITREQPTKEPNKTHKEVSPKTLKPLNPRGHKTLLHESLAFPALRGSACNAVINGTFQIQKLPLSFGLLACYHLVPMKKSESLDLSS